MTPKQEIAEKRSIQDFVEKELFERRPRGTDAATSTVIYMAIKTAAEMSPRNKDGKISVRDAREILRRAIAVLGA